MLPRPLALALKVPAFSTCPPHRRPNRAHGAWARIPHEEAHRLPERSIIVTGSMGGVGTTTMALIKRWRQNDDEPVARSEKDLKQSFFARLPSDFRQVSEAVTLGIPLTAGSNNPLVGRYRDLAARLRSPAAAEARSRADAPVAVGQK